MDPHTIIQLLHVLILGPFLIAVGLDAVSIPSYAFVALGAFIILYHAYKTYAKIANGQNPWVNVIHVLVVGPALVAHGLLPSERWTREVVLMLGFAAVGYHGYYLVRQ